MTNQKDAVYEEVKRLKPDLVDKDRPVVLAKSEKKDIEARLFDGFKKGKIPYKNGELPSDDKLAVYVQGLVSNWLRKDDRLNGQTKYVPKRTNGGASNVASIVAASSANPRQLEALQHLVGPGEEVEVLVIRRRPQGSTASGSSIGEVHAAAAQE